MADLDSAQQGMDGVVKEIEQYIDQLKQGKEDDYSGEKIKWTAYCGLQELSFSFFETPFIELP